jgi:hypothetical protein
MKKNGGQKSRDTIPLITGKTGKKCRNKKQDKTKQNTSSSPQQQKL